MLYSPERNSLAGTAPAGIVLCSCERGAGAHSGRCRTLHRV